MTLLYKLSVFLEKFSIHVDRPALSQVFDHVPVQSRNVLSAGLGITVAQGQVNGSADLFIEQNVLDELLDHPIGADAQFAQAPGSGIGIEHDKKVFFVFGGRSLDNPALAKHQAYAVDLSPTDTDGEIEGDVPVGGGLNRPGKDLAAGYVVHAVGIDERSAFDRKPQVGLPPDDADLIGAARQSQAEAQAIEIEDSVEV